MGLGLINVTNHTYYNVLMCLQTRIEYSKDLQSIPCGWILLSFIDQIFNYGVETLSF